MTEKAIPLRPMLVAAVLVLAIGSGIGYLFGPANTGDWYRNLAKPALNPPSWLFGVVWPVLYLMIGASGGLIWSARKRMPTGRARFWYGLQLILNFSWTPIFFGMQRVDIALGIIVALNIAAIVATLHMGRIRALAAWLMVPYLIWIAFAATLNFRIWQLMPGLPT
ncbi:MAG: TspO/MBR family protein [Pacificimonas sp.]